MLRNYFYKLVRNGSGRNYSSSKECVQTFLAMLCVFVLTNMSKYNKA